MRPIKRGDQGPAVTEIRGILDALGLLAADIATAPTGVPAHPSAPAPVSAVQTASTAEAAPTASVASTAEAASSASTAEAALMASAAEAASPAPPGLALFDEEIERAIRAFQQSRGLTVDGEVGDETWRSLDASRWRLGARTLYQAIPDPLVGDDVRELQERLLEMGFDVGRADGIYGPATARAVAVFQREVGLSPDGACGPHTLHALRRLGRKVVGGSPQLLREAERFRQSGPALVGKTIIIDPGHGGTDLGVVVPDGQLRWTEADLAFDLAARLEGRLAVAGMRVHLTRGPSPTRELSDPDRAKLANDLSADLLISIHLDGHANPEADGVATYHYGTSNGVSSTVGERLAGLVQREIVMRTGLRNCRTHAMNWEILRLTRMPAVRVEAGYLTSPKDRERLVDPLFRERLVESIVAAVQRMYYPVEQDVPTGSIDVSAIRALAAAG